MMTSLSIAHLRSWGVVLATGSILSYPRASSACPDTADLQQQIDVAFRDGKTENMIGLDLAVIVRLREHIRSSGAPPQSECSARIAHALSEALSQLQSLPASSPLRCRVSHATQAFLDADFTAQSEYRSTVEQFYRAFSTEGCPPPPPEESYKTPAPSRPTAPTISPPVPPPGPIVDPRPPEVSTPSSAPKRPLLWVLLGSASGVSAVATGVTGFLGQRRFEAALRANDAACSASTCTNTAAVESAYPSAEYHGGLRRALYLQSSAVALAGTSLGLVLGGLGHAVPRRHRRPLAYTFLGLGTALAGTGIGLVTFVSTRIEDDLGGSELRATRDGLDAHRSLYLGGGALVGAGIGLVTGAVLSVILDRRINGPMRAAHRPILVGLTVGKITLSGNF